MAKWTDRKIIEGEEIEAWQSARCSACGKWHTAPYLYSFDVFNFCPYCGADMRGEDDE